MTHPPDAVVRQRLIVGRALGSGESRAAALRDFAAVDDVEVGVLAAAAGHRAGGGQRAGGGLVIS